MRLHLYRSLLAKYKHWLTLSLLLMSSLCFAEPAALTSDEQLNYLRQLKQQHATADNRTALLAEVNSLLAQHALRAGYQVGYSNPQDFLYSVNVAKQGELLIREEIRSSQNSSLEVRSHRINVFGIDPFVNYDCPPQGVRCMIFAEDKNTAILTIVRNQQAAKDLARALSYLIRNMQRG